jgi:non-specific serine/threonine protein kinase
VPTAAEAHDTAGDPQDRLADWPRPLSSFIGRERETAAIVDLLCRDRLRLLTITGPGGVGKTRLALAAAELAAKADFPDGVAFVPLAPVADPILVLPTVASAVGIRGAGLESAGDRLADALGRRRLLLVLDNLEHLPAVGPALAALLGTCPNLAILATSRSPLGVTGEQVFPLGPLALPPIPAPTAATALAAPAVRLFAERAAAVAPAVVVTDDNAATVTAICARLDGLPLAIELAAARSALLPPAALLARLDPRLPLLTGGSRDQPDRLRSLRGAIAWSHDLLPPAAQTLFRRLAGFAGGFTLDGADAVLRAADSGPSEVGRSVLPSAAAPQPSALDLVGTLLEHSLVARLDGGWPDDVVRYGMLETVREFARERLAASGEGEAVMAHHAVATLEWLAGLEPDLLGPREGELTAWVEADWDNIRAAVAWGLVNDPALVLGIGDALWAYVVYSGQMDEARRWLSAALAATGESPRALWARAQVALEAIRNLQGEFVAGAPLAAAALPHLRAADDRGGVARALWVVGLNIGLFLGRPAEASALLDESLHWFAEASTATDRVFAARAMNHVGMCQFLAGDRDRGFATYEASLIQLRRDGSAAFVAAGFEFGAISIEAGDFSRARRLATEGLAVAYPRRIWWLAAGPLLSLGLVEVAEGRPAAGARLLAAGLALAGRFGVVAPPTALPLIDRARAQAERELGPDAFAAAWATGQAWSVAEAVAAADDVGSTVRAPKTGPAADRPPLSGLTGQEHRVLGLVAAGRTDKEIAVALGISARTASNHVANIRRKLGVPSRAAATALAQPDDLR